MKRFKTELLELTGAGLVLYGIDMKAGHWAAMIAAGVAVAWIGWANR